MGIVEQYLLQLNTSKQRFRRRVALLLIMSLLVMLAVSWNLRQTGIAIANDACCGMEEHRHTEECILEKSLICGYDVMASTEEPMETPTETQEETATLEETTEPTEPEHSHTDECYELVYQCGLEEHIHTISCYSDLSADLEDWDVWAASVPALTGRVSEDIVLVAQAQLGNR